MKQYDYLIVGCGLFGAVFAHEARKKGKSVLFIEKRNHIGGNIYCELQEDILVHKYGAHIFHTSNKRVWEYVNQFVEFNNFINAPIANYKGEIYNLPFNMNTFSKMFHISTPQQAQEIIEAQRGEIKGEPQNLEEQAISLVGREVYTKLIKGYTESNGDATVRICLRLLSNACLCAIPIIIIILMTVTRVFRLKDIRLW